MDAEGTVCTNRAQELGAHIIQALPAAVKHNMLPDE